MKKYLFLATLTLINLFVVGHVNGQQWERIIPLISKCDDVKKIFSLSKCAFPVTRIELASKEIDINFSTSADEWAVPNDTVVSMLVIFHELPKLFDYTTGFKDYIIKHELDAPEILLYRNDQKGVRLTVQTGMAKGLYIGSVFLYPSQENVQRLKQATRRKKR